jgi:hypothetical protein
MNKDAYIKEVTHRLHMRFSQSKEGVKLPDSNRFRLEGFMQAGVFIGLVSNGEFNHLIEHIHLDVFGQTVAERKEALQGQWQEEAIDYNSYDSPSYQRNNT